MGNEYVSERMSGCVSEWLSGSERMFEWVSVCEWVCVCEWVGMRTFQLVSE
jgi:hypothetical protein